MASVTNVCSTLSDTATEGCGISNVLCNSPSGYVLLELSSLEHVSSVFTSDSNKAITLDVSVHYVAVGTANGKVFLFPRLGACAQSLGSIPIQVVHPDTCPVFKVAISPDENYLAIANRKGLLAIYRLSSTGFAAYSAEHSYQCDCSAEEINFATALCWTWDSRRIYAGDLKGRISCTFVKRRDASCPITEILLETDSEVVQIETHKNLLLISTLTRTCIYDLGTLNCVQIGKKLRYGYYGCAFGNKCVQKSPSSDSLSHQQRSHNDEDSGTYIFACRPNGRIWYSNKLGVVLRTYQYRPLLQTVNVPLISYRNSFVSKPNIDDDEPLCFKLIHHLSCETKQFMLLNSTSRFYIIDPLDGKLVLCCDVQETFDEYAVFGSSILAVSPKTGALRQFMISKVEKAVQLLCLKSLFTQAANIVMLLETPLETTLRYPWTDALLRCIIEGLKNSDAYEQNKEIEPAFIQSLRRILDLAGNRPLSNTRKNLQNGASAKDSVFPFSADGRCEFQYCGRNKLRVFRSNSDLKRCKSAPEFSRVMSLKMPLVPSPQRWYSSEELDMFHPCFTDYSKAARDTEQRSLFMGSTESLKIILNYNFPIINFESSITISDVPRELSAAKKFFETTARNIRLQNTLMAKKNEEPEAVISVPEDEVNVKRLRLVKRGTCGARIAKVIRPGGRQTYKATEVMGEDSDADVTSDTTTSSSSSPRQGAVPSSTVLAPSLQQKLETPLQDQVSQFDAASEKEHRNAVATRCINCGLHKSWVVVLMFGPVVEHLKVVVDHFNDGGVPVTSDEWGEFFDGYLFSRPSRIISAQKLCPECATCFEFEKHIKSKREYILQFYTRRQRLTDEAIRDRQYVRDCALSLNDDVVYNLFFKQSALPSDIGGLTNDVEETADTGAKTEKAETKDFDENKKQWFLRNFSPLLSLQLIQLINCMRLCQGMDAVFSLLSRHKLKYHLTRDDWQWLVVLQAYQLGKSRQDFPQSFVSSVLSEFKLNNIIECDASAAATEDRSENVSSRTAAPSVVFSANGSCPFCTLPLKTIVSDTERSVAVFSCGHAYHKVCLRETNLNHCVRCELERRRLRRQIDVAFNRNAKCSGFNCPVSETLDNRCHAKNLFSNVTENKFKHSYSK